MASIALKRPEQNRRRTNQESEAREAIRSPITKIVATPVPTTGKHMTLDLRLYGEVAGILVLSLGSDLMSGHQKTSCEQEVMQSVEFLVAGTGFEPVTFRL